MATFILTAIINYIIYAILVGIAFYSLRQRFEWNISNKLCLVILIIIFALSDLWLLPALYSLDATITIRNQAIATFLETKQDFLMVNLFIPDKFNIMIWGLQSLGATFIGNKLFPKK